MESPEGRGIARRAWEGYAGAVGKVTTLRFGRLFGCTRRAALSIWLASGRSGIWRAASKGCRRWA